MKSWILVICLGSTVALADPDGGMGVETPRPWMVACRHTLDSLDPGTLSTSRIEPPTVTFERERFVYGFANGIRFEVHKKERPLRNDRPLPRDGLPGAIPRTLVRVSWPDGGSTTVRYGMQMLAYEAEVVLLSRRPEDDLDPKIATAVTSCLAGAERAFGNKPCDAACPPARLRTGRSCRDYCFDW